MAADFALDDALITPYTQEGGDANFSTQYAGDFEIARYNNTIYRYGNLFDSTDKLKLVGRE